VVAERVIVDAGPLVALLNKRDAFHSICSEVATALPRPMISSWAVLAESAWLLRNTHNGQQRLLQLVATV
jgi:uncharacterized protein